MLSVGMGSPTPSLCRGIGVRRGRPLWLGVLVALCLITAAACAPGDDEAGREGASSTSGSTTTAPPGHPLIAAVAAERGVDEAEAERWLETLAADTGVTIDYFFAVWDGTDLYSPVSPLLESIRRALPGGSLEGICPPAGAIAPAVAPGPSQGGRVVVVAPEHPAPVFDLPGASQTYDGLTRGRYGALHQLSRLPGYVDSYWALGDASPTVVLGEGTAGDTRIEFPSGWLATRLQDLELIACVRRERTDEVIKRCSYSGGAVVVQTMRTAVVVDIFRARSAALLQTVTVPGPDDPTECPPTVALTEEMRERARSGPLLSWGSDPAPALVLDALAPLLGPAAP